MDPHLTLNPKRCLTVFYLFQSQSGRLNGDSTLRFFSLFKRMVLFGFRVPHNLFD
jgi:hypothetical protein